MFFKYLKGGDVEITAVYPAGVIGKTLENLEAAADGEKLEWSEIYLGMEKTAREEGFADIATTFKEISEVEEAHEKRYRKLAANVAKGEVFKKKTVVKWKCANCGYVHKGTEAPKVCRPANTPGLL